MLTWISEKGAKWVIYIFGIGIVVGLLSLGQTNLDTDKTPPVAKVNGKVISASDFRRVLDPALEQYAGANLSEKDRSQIRTDLLDRQIQGLLLAEQVKQAKLGATVAEMRWDLENNPPESWKQAEVFQTDSAFDVNKWKAFLGRDSSYDLEFMRGYENYLRTEKVPMLQLQGLVASGLHPSSLEARFTVERRENRFRMAVVSVAVDSFVVDPASVTDAEIQKSFDAQPDSFIVDQNLAKYDYVAIEVKPSARDEENGHKFCEWLLEQVKQGGSFAELATSHSEDPGSAVKGGSLGGFQAMDRWVKPFADAALALDSGAISAPVRTQFGWHVIRSNGKKMVDGVVQMDLSHILVRVVPGTETLDSLRAVLNKARNAIVDDGKKFADVVAAESLKVAETSWLGRGESLPGMGFLPGLTSYGFAKDDNGVSELLENAQWIALFHKKADLKAGTRDMARFSDAIRSKLALERQMIQAQEWLKGQLAAVPMPTLDSLQAKTLAKAIYQESGWVNREAFVPAIGFASPLLDQAWKMEVGAWSTISAGDRAAVAFRVLEKQPAVAADLPQLAQREVANSWQFAGQGLFGEWIKELERQAEVERNLDVFFSE
jgi:peptidyl-prolyl cis-trans isomerase D